MIIKGKLTSDANESEVFSIEGEASILIQGEGNVSLLRSVGNSQFLPVTDSAGEEVMFFGDDPESVMFNGDYTNKSQACKFKLQADTPTEIEFYIASGW